MVETKECSACCEIKPQVEFYFDSSQDRYRAQCKACVRAYHRKRRRDNPELCKEIYWRGYLKRNYGITPEEHDVLKAEGCAICGDMENPYGKGVGLVVDHDHATGRIRGALCSFCNRAIGQLREDPALLRRAAEYLEAHQ